MREDASVDNEWYLLYLDTLAVPIVGDKTWRDAKEHLHSLQEVLTPSNEAFFLLVILNYKDSWVNEFEAQTDGDDGDTVDADRDGENTRKRHGSVSFRIVISNVTNHHDQLNLA